MVLNLSRTRITEKTDRKRSLDKRENGWDRRNIEQSRDRRDIAGSRERRITPNGPRRDRREPLP